MFNNLYDSAKKIEIEKTDISEALCNFQPLEFKNWPKKLYAGQGTYGRKVLMIPFPKPKDGKRFLVIHQKFKDDKTIFEISALTEIFYSNIILYDEIEVLLDFLARGQFSVGALKFMADKCCADPEEGLEDMRKIMFEYGFEEVT
jgi:hypothetical protein